MRTDAGCSNTVTTVQAKQATSFRLVSAQGDYREPTGQSPVTQCKNTGLVVLLCSADPFPSVPQGWLLLPPSLSRLERLCRPLLWKGAPENHEPSSLLSHSIAISLEIPGLSGALLGPNVLLSDPRMRLRPTWMERSRTVYSTHSLTPCTWMVKGP